MKTNFNLVRSFNSRLVLPKNSQLLSLMLNAKSMVEIITSNEKGNDRLIAFVDGTIYKANPKTDQETDILASGLKSASFDSTKLWEIKTRNCKEIRLQDSKPYIEIFWRKSGEEQL